MRFQLRLVTGMVALVGIASACSDPPASSGEVDRVLTVAAGNNQTGPISQFVPITPMVKVATSAGAPLANVTVHWKVGVASGQITTATVLTGSDGTATPDAWRLSSVAGTNTLVASVNSANPASVTFTATSVAAGNGAARR